VTPYRFFVPTMRLPAWPTVGAIAEDAGPSPKATIVLVLRAAHPVSAYWSRINRTPIASASHEMEFQR